VEEGKIEWVDLLREFYNYFSGDVEKAEKNLISNLKTISTME